MVPNKRKRAEEVFFSDDTLSMAIKYYDVPCYKSQFTHWWVSLKNMFNLGRTLCLTMDISDIIEYKKHPKLILLLLKGVRDGDVNYKAYDTDGNVMTSDFNRLAYFEIYNGDIYSEVHKEGTVCEVIEVDDNLRGNRLDVLKYGLSSHEIYFLHLNICAIKDRSAKKAEKEKYNMVLKKVESFLD